MPRCNLINWLIGPGPAWLPRTHLDRGLTPAEVVQRLQSVALVMGFGEVPELRGCYLGSTTHTLLRACPVMASCYH